MNADGPAPNRASRDLSSARAGGPPERVRGWRHDVMEGVTRRVGAAAIPALLLSILFRAFRREWHFVALMILPLAVAGVSLVRSLPPRLRVAMIAGAFVWINTFMMVYARQIPFHGVMMPIASASALLMGGPRWGWSTLAITGVTWVVPWALTVGGWPSPVDMPLPTQYIRIWFFNCCLSAGILASILHVTRHLETALSHSDVLLDRIRTEARDVQALAGRVREAEEAERRRLAHDLHDDFGQRLTALRMKLQLSKVRPDQRAAALDDCIAMSEELMQDVRTFARGLRPPLLDEVGLGPALRALLEAHHVDPSASVKTIDVQERLPRLAPPIELAIYRVVQEAIANVARHADATRLSVAARVEDGEIVVWVIDNGRGFRPDQVHAAHEHLGLVSMRERAGFAGGRLEVDSSPGHGTRLSLRVPIAAPATAATRRAVGS